MPLAAPPKPHIYTHPADSGQSVRFVVLPSQNRKAKVKLTRERKEGGGAKSVAEVRALPPLLKELLRTLLLAHTLAADWQGGPYIS